MKWHVRLYLPEVGPGESLAKAELAPLRAMSSLSARDTQFSDMAPTAFIFFCTTDLHPASKTA